MEIHKNKMNELFALSSHGLFGNIEKYNILDISHLSVDDLYIFRFQEQKITEDLKLGQKDKVLLSKLILGNLFVSLFLAILVCLIFTIIKDDTYNAKS